MIKEITQELEKTTGELQKMIDVKNVVQEDNGVLENKVALLETETNKLREQLGILLQENLKLQPQTQVLELKAGETRGKEKKPVYSQNLYFKSGNSKLPTDYTGVKKGGGKDNCETMLTLLLFHLKQKNYNVQEFLDKAGATLDDLGQCPLVLHLLNDMLKEAEELQIEKRAVLFSPIQNETTKLVMESLENAIQGRFTEEEQEFLSTLSKPITFYSHPPEQFEHTLGTEPYMVYDDGHDDVMLKGVGEDIQLTNEERNAIEEGGVSLGAVTFLYLNSLQDKARLMDGTYSPTEVSKCLGPQRSKERAKTPKQKHKRKPQHKA